MKRATIQMVAEAAKVSRGTVDRVLNQRSHVSKDVYDRVMRAIEETGYLSPRQMHSLALNVNKSKKSLIPVRVGLLLPNFDAHFRSEVLKGVETARTELEESNSKIFIEECKTDVPQESVQLLNRLVEKGVQGISMCAPNAASVTERVNELAESNIPVITFNSDLPESRRLCFIGQDYNQSGRIAGEIMSKCVSSDGHVLAAVGNLEFDGHYSRFSGFHDRLIEVGFPEEKIHVIETFNDYAVTYRKIIEALTSETPYKAVYMANQSVAGCTEAINTLNKKKALRVICHDMNESTKLLLEEGNVDFTITQDIYRQGYLPIIMLREYLNKGELPDSERISPHISIICSQNI